MLGSKPKKTERKRRPKGEGSFEQLENGLWRCRIIVAGKPIYGHQSPTRAEAGASAREAVEKLKRGAAPAKGQSFTTYARSWAAERAKKLSPTTAETEGYWVNYIAKDMIGLTPVAKITTTDLEGWASRLPIASSTARNLCRWVNQMMRAAGSEARAPVPKKTQHQRRPLSPKEQSEMRDVMDALDEETRRMLLIAWGMGLRRSEICGLRHEDRDGDGVWIRRVVVIAKGTMIVRDKTKSPKGSGWVPIPPFLDAMIGHGQTGFVVSLAPKIPANPKALSSRLTEALRGKDLRNVPFLGAHALRRTYGMAQLESGAEAVTVADSMRHDVQMLLNEYARSRRDLKSAAVNRAFANWDQVQKPAEKPA